MVSGDLTIFSANKSFLLRKRIIDVSSNHLLLQIESNSFILSIIRFCVGKKERERECVCVCVRERERGKGKSKHNLTFN